MMKIITISATFLLLFTMYVLSYVPIEEYNGIKFKIYDQEVNVSECKAATDRIPEKYFSGISVIKIASEHRKYVGYYHWGGSITMLGNCDEGILIHELGHHLQYLRGDTLHNVASHTGRFYQFEEEILNDILPNKSH